MLGATRLASSAVRRHGVGIYSDVAQFVGSRAPQAGRHWEKIRELRGPRGGKKHCALGRDVVCNRQTPPPLGEARAAARGPAQLGRARRARRSFGGLGVAGGGR